MGNQVQRHGIPVHDRTEALSLIHDGRRCFGAVCRCLRTGDLVTHTASATVIATGGCATMANGKGFLGAAGLNRIAGFMLDPRDRRETADYLHVLGTDEGLFGCFETMMCEDNCPLNLPVEDHMEYVREKFSRALGLFDSPEKRE